jgi:hypothetical protein
VNYMRRCAGLAVLAAALVMPVLSAGSAAAQPGSSVAVGAASDAPSGVLDSPDGVIWNAGQVRVGT